MNNFGIDISGSDFESINFLLKSNQGAREIMSQTYDAINLVKKRNVEKEDII